VIVVSGVLVLVAVVLLILGWLIGKLSLVFGSIALSALAVAGVAVLVRRLRHEPVPVVTGGHPGLAEPAAGGVVAGRAMGRGSEPAQVPVAEAPSAADLPAAPSSASEIGAAAPSAADAGSTDPVAVTTTPAPGGPAGADDPPVEEPVDDELEYGGPVWMVRGRPRYHAQDCQYLTGQASEQVDALDARDDGLTPCGVCKPDEALQAAYELHRDASVATPDDGDDVPELQRPGAQVGAAPVVDDVAAAAETGSVDDDGSMPAAAGEYVEQATTGLPQEATEPDPDATAEATEAAQATGAAASKVPAAPAAAPTEEAVPAQSDERDGEPPGEAPVNDVLVEGDDPSQEVSVAVVKATALGVDADTAPEPGADASTEQIPERGPQPEPRVEPVPAAEASAHTVEDATYKGDAEAPTHVGEDTANEQETDGSACTEPVEEPDTTSGRESGAETGTERPVEANAGIAALAPTRAAAPSRRGRPGKPPRRPALSGRAQAAVPVAAAAPSGRPQAAVPGAAAASSGRAQAAVPVAAPASSSTVVVPAPSRSALRPSPAGARTASVTRRAAPSRGTAPARADTPSHATPPPTSRVSAPPRPAGAVPAAGVLRSGGSRTGRVRQASNDPGMSAPRGVAAAAGRAGALGRVAPPRAAAAPLLKPQPGADPSRRAGVSSVRPAPLRLGVRPTGTGVGRKVVSVAARSSAGCAPSSSPSPGTAPTVLVVGDRDRFHRPSCRHVQGVSDARQLSRADAQRAGSACSLCRP